MSIFGIQNLFKTSAYDYKLIEKPKISGKFFLGGLFQQIIESFGIQVHTQL
jgi:hypothetical protein